MKKEEFVWFIVQGYFVLSGKPGQQELEAAHDIVSAVRKW